MTKTRKAIANVVVIVLLSYQVVASGYVDLCDAGMQYDFEPKKIDAGDSITIDGSIKNAGTERAGVFQLAFYASLDTVIDPNEDYQLGSIGTFGFELPPDEPFNWRPFHAPRQVDIPGGEYYVGWIIDCANWVDESDETNNVVCITTMKLRVEPIVKKPTVVTLEAINVGARNATFVGRIVDNGGQPYRYQFEYQQASSGQVAVPSLQSNAIRQGRLNRLGVVSPPSGVTRIVDVTVLSPLQYTGWTPSVPNSDTFRQTVTGLEPDSTYHIFATARNSAGSGRGEVVGIKTVPAPEVVGVSSPYFDDEKHSYFLDGVSRITDVIVKIDWHGLEPDRIEWRTPKRTYHDTCASGQTEVSHRFDMGTEFGVSGTLKLRAISKGLDPGESDWVTAQFSVIPPPPGVPLDLLRSAPTGSRRGGAPPDPAYLTPDYTVNLLDDSTVGAFPIIPERIPVFGGFGCGISASTEGHVRVLGGTAEFEHARGDTTANFTIAGMSLGGNAYLGHVYWEYRDGKWDSYGILTLDLRKKSPRIPLGKWWPLYGYARVYLNSVSAIEFLDWEEERIPDWSLGCISINPMVSVTAGAGVEGIIGGELTIGGGPKILLAFPEKSLRKFCVVVWADVKVYFLWWEKTLWDDRWEFCDINGSTGPCLLSSEQTGLDFDRHRFKLMDRGYLGPDYAVWMPSVKHHPQRDITSSTPAEPSGQRRESDVFRQTGLAWTTAQSGEEGNGFTGEQVLQANIFRDSQPAMASANGKLWMAWLYDDPNRSSMNRTQLVFSESDDAIWQLPSPVHDDGTADFSPQLAVLPTGQVLCTWANVGRPLSDDVDLAGMASTVEIAVAAHDDGSGVWNTEILTSNSHLDFSPSLAAAENGTALVMWLSNEKDDILRQDPNAPNVIQYSLWNGSAWSGVRTAATGTARMFDATLAYNGVEATYVYAAGTGTQSSEELYALTYDGIQWSQPRRLTNDALRDANPQVVCDPDGFLLVWYRDGDLVSCRDLDIASLQQVLTSSESLEPVDFRLARSEGGHISLVWTDLSTQSQGADIFAVMYDPRFDLWGNPLALTSDHDTERSLAVTYVGSDELALAYNKDRIRTDGENAWEPYQTDLCVLRRTVARDLAVATQDISVSEANPAPGSVVQLTAIIRNLGDVAEADVSVGFYHGDPDGGGALIADLQTISGPIPAGGQAEVTVLWTVPQADTPQEVYVTVPFAPDTASDLPERSLANNTASVSVMAPDLTVESVVVQKTGYKKRRITAWVSNQGIISARNAEAVIRLRSTEGQELEHFTIPVIDANSAQEIAYDWDIAGMAFEEPEVALHVVVDDNQHIAESDERNNAASVLVHVSKPGDVTDDGRLDGADLAVLGICWLETRGDPDWLPSCDLNHDGRIGLGDLAILGKDWRWEATWHTK